MSETNDKTVWIDPSDSAIRRRAVWCGLTAETVQITTDAPYDYGFRAPVHLFTVVDLAVRSDGETLVEGLLRSTRRDISQTMTFVPAGRTFRGSFVPLVRPRITYFYIDPKSTLAEPGLGFADLEFEPMLFFEDPSLWNTAQKLSRLMEAAEPDDPLYAEALAALLIVELTHLHPARRRSEPRPAPEHGGLASWQQRLVCEYLEENLDCDVSLVELATMVRLSLTQFCDAFTRTLGMPPHRYYIHRRIERAKVLLADRCHSVTEVARACGFSSPSAFALIFRKVSGLTPREYRGSLN